MPNEVWALAVAADGTLYVAKGGVTSIDRSGAIKWSRAIGGSDSNEGPYSHGVATDGDDVIVTGTFLFGVLGLTNGSSDQVYVAKFNSAGDLRWAAQSGTDYSQGAYGQDVGVDGAGNLYVVVVSSEVRQMPNSWKAVNFHFIRKYDADGRLVFHRAICATARPAVARLAVAHSGEHYVVGRYHTELPFGSTNTAVGFGEQWQFFAKYSPVGDLLWMHTVGGTNVYTYVQDVALDKLGNSYLCGWFTESLSLGTTNVVGDTNPNLFVAKYDSNGHVQHVIRSGGTGEAGAFRIAVDDRGDQYIHGPAFGSVTLGHTNIEGRHVITAKYNSSGALVWVTCGEYWYRGPRAIVVDPAGNAYVGGDQSPDPWSLGYLLKYATTAPGLAVNLLSGQVSLSWSSLAEDFLLESVSAFSSESWVPVPADQVASNAVSATYAVPAGGPQQFFRLRPSKRQ